MIWRSEPFDRRLEIAPVLANDKLIIAIDRSGLIRAAQRPLDAEILLALGDWQAAISFFEDRDQPAQAAAIYEQKGLPAEAAAIWEKAGELEKAANCRSYVDWRKFQPTNPVAGITGEKTMG